MNKMKRLLFLFLPVVFLNGIHGQVPVTEPLSTTVGLGDDVSLRCTTTENNPTFVWIDNDSGRTIYSGTQQITQLPKYDNFVLEEGTATETSILNINGIELEDDGGYRCELNTQGDQSDVTMVTVEVGSQTSEEISLASIDGDTRYRAVYNSLESKPAEIMTWILDDIVQTDGIEIMDLGATLPLYSTRSTFTFPATVENYDVLLVCNISGHQVARFNRQESRRVDIHSLPQNGSIEIRIDVKDSTLDVTCDRSSEAQPTPAITNFYIYSNDTFVEDFSSVTSATITVPKPEQDTEFKCEAGNYLGNATTTRTYEPGRPTTPSTTTESSTAEGTTTERPADMMTSPEPNDGNETGPPSGGDGPSAAAIGGGVAGAIVFIIIIVIVIIYFKKRGKDGPSAASSTKKHGSSAVGTSNGSEKDKIKPVAAPRDQGSIQHTTDNPGQAEYAMVDRKKPGGDMPDTRGPGQKEPQGMLYADLDLSASAGHTEKKVPQNKDDVVVYSSILV